MVVSDGELLVPGDGLPTCCLDGSELKSSFDASLRSDETLCFTSLSISNNHLFT